MFLPLYFKFCKKNITFFQKMHKYHFAIHFILAAIAISISDSELLSIERKNDLERNRENQRVINEKFMYKEREQ